MVKGKITQIQITIKKIKNWFIHKRIAKVLMLPIKLRNEEKDSNVNWEKISKCF